MDESTKLARKMGLCPDVFWYQMNDKSPYENLEEQKNKFFNQLGIPKLKKEVAETIESTIESAIEDLLENM